MIDLKTYRPLLLLAASLTLMLGLTNLTLLGLTGPAPTWLVPEHRPMPWDDLQSNEARICSLEKVCDATAPGSAPAFYVYVGLSTAWQGIEPEILQANCGVEGRPFGIIGRGGAMEDLLRLTDPFFEAELTPTLAIVCVHPFMLVGRPIEDPPESLDPSPALLRGDWQEGVRIAGWWNWLSNNHSYLERAVETTCQDIRGEMGAITPSSDPWTGPKRLDYPPRFDAQTLRIQLTRHESFGRFDRIRYEEFAKRQLNALEEIVSSFRACGSEVLVILMPEAKILRERVPLEPRQWLETSMQTRFAENPPHILDLQASLPDALFSDHCHLNKEGRKRFSHLLARAIKRRMLR